MAEIMPRGTTTRLIAATLTIAALLLVPRVIGSMNLHFSLLYGDIARTTLQELESKLAGEGK